MNEMRLEFGKVLEDLHLKFEKAFFKFQESYQVKEKLKGRFDKFLVEAVKHDQVKLKSNGDLVYNFDREGS